LPIVGNGKSQKCGLLGRDHATDELSSFHVCPLIVWAVSSVRIVGCAWDPCPSSIISFGASVWRTSSIDTSIRHTLRRLACARTGGAVALHHRREGADLPSAGDGTWLRQRHVWDRRR